MRNDHDRLALLRSLAILDTSPEVVFDDLSRAMADAFDVPIAMVNLLDVDRDWFKSCIGLPGNESPASTSFCEVFFHTTEDLVIVQDTSADLRFSRHPLVVGGPLIRFYAAARLSVRGHTVGTLCVYDTKVKDIASGQLDTLRILSRAAMELLERRMSSNMASP